MKREAIGKRLRFQVLSRDGFRCYYCGQKAPDVALHVDHVVPVAAGGSTTLGNLVSCCQDCNLGKSAALIPGRTRELDRERREESAQRGVYFDMQVAIDFWVAVANSDDLYTLTEDILIAETLAAYEPLVCANLLWYGTSHQPGFLHRFTALGLTGDLADFIEWQLRERLPECRGCGCSIHLAQIKRTLPQFAVHEQKLERLEDGGE